MLSKLPEEVLDRILCFLPLKEAVRTCLLSKSWQHLGTSLSKLELRQFEDFDGDSKRLLSVLDTTLQRYNHQNLSLKNLTLKMIYHHILKGVKLDLPSIALKVEFLEELSLRNCDLSHISFTTEDHKRPLFKHLRKLTLDRVDITKEVLEVMLSSTCPWIECLCVILSSEFMNVDFRKARYLKHFEFSHGSLSTNEIDIPTLETIKIKNCHKWRFCDNNYFPRLKSLCLTCVRLATETFGFFTSNYMPSLLKLELHRCYGCKEFQLSSSSIKYISIIYLLDATKASIDAPNISCFKLKPYHPLPSISFTPISIKWKSHLDLLYVVRDHRTALLWILELHEVIKALSQSQITLKLNVNILGNQGLIVDTTYGGLYNNKPLVVEHLSLEVCYCSLSIVAAMFNNLFRVFRPRYIHNAHIQDSRELTIILWKFLLQEREKRTCYFWDKDLVEVSMESRSYHHPNVWHSVLGNSFLECAFPDSQNIRFRLKWRGS